MSHLVLVLGRPMFQFAIEQFQRHRHDGWLPDNNPLKVFETRDELWAACDLVVINGGRTRWA
jgi:hypothetical protein